jgi:hypothetical protein
MDLHPLIPLGWFLAGTLVLAAALIGCRRRCPKDPNRERARRAAGHVLLGLEEFIAPSVEFVRQAENAEQRKEDEGSAAEDERAAVLADLAQSLAFNPVDHEEVRRHLATAERAGLDWRALFEQAVRDELTARPYRAPAIPPLWRVSPRR